MIIQTKSVRNKWIELGAALGVPIKELEKINHKHHGNPMYNLIRVYRYWLAYENGLMPTWKKLVHGLYQIDEYSLADSFVNAMVSLCIAISDYVVLINNNAYHY